MVDRECVRLTPEARGFGCRSSCYGCSLRCIQPQPPVHTVAAPVTCGCSPNYMRLQPPARAVAGVSEGAKEFVARAMRAEPASRPTAEQLRASL